MSNAALVRKLLCIGGVALALSSMTVNSAAAVTTVADNAADIVCQLSIPGQLPRGQPAVLTVTLHNRSKGMLKLLRRNTPLEGWLADSMTVERDGQALPYVGAMAKRAPPSASEYLRLKAGARFVYRASLQDAYDVTAAGSYRVVWRGEVMDAFFGDRRPDPEHMSARQIACPAVAFVRLP